MSSSADTGPVGLRILLTLAWPVILARLTQTVINLADAAMVAPLGDEAFAATTTGATNSFTLVILPMGIVFIVQSFAAQLLGRGELEAARRYAWYGLAVAAVAGAIALALIPLVAPLVGMLRNTAEVNRLMASYLDIRLIGVGAVVGTEALGSWFGGLGNTRIQMRASVIAMIANVALNWILIHGKLGAPALGVEGAAWASTLANGLGFAVVALAFTQSTVGKTERLGLRRSEFVRMLRFGLPNGLNWFLEFAAYAVFVNVMVAELGTSVLAALNIVIQLNGVAFMPAFGMTSAGAILVGQAVGRGAKDAVGGIVWLTAKVTLAWMSVIGLIYLAFPSVPVGWLAPHGDGRAAVLAVGGTMLAISAAWQLFDAAAMTLGEALRAAGDTAWCLWARLAVAWFVFVPSAWLSVFVFDLGHIAVMLCLVLYLALLAAVLLWRYRSGKWREIDLTGTEAALIA